MTKASTIGQEKLFQNLPDVLIQDSKNASSYFIPSKELEKFLVSDNIDISENTMTFVVPDENYLEEVNYYQTGENPSVLIKFPKGKSQYLLNNDELVEFKVTSFEEMTRITDQCMAFIIPTGDEFLEDIPNMSPAMLQSGTAPTEFPKPIEKLV